MKTWSTRMHWQIPIFTTTRSVKLDISFTTINGKLDIFCWNGYLLHEVIILIDNWKYCKLIQIKQNCVLI